MVTMGGGWVVSFPTDPRSTRRLMIIRSVCHQCELSRFFSFGRHVFQQSSRGLLFSVSVAALTGSDWYCQYRGMVARQEVGRGRSV